MQDELTLFRKMQKGDWKAFSFFFECYAEQLFHYVLGFVKCKEEAEDIVQEVFIYLWTNRERIEYTGSVYAYLFRAVKNSCVDYKLHEKVEERYRQEVQMTEKEDEESVEENADDLYANIQLIMETLPQKCREIFIMGCVESMTYKEIAEQLNISVNTVKTQMKVAYKKIREELGDKKMLLLLSMLTALSGGD